MSLISSSKSLPAPWMVAARSTCLGVNVPSLFSARIFDRINRLLSGVRSSCDMLARNSDLYLELSASCCTFLFQRRACLFHVAVGALQRFSLFLQHRRLLFHFDVALLQLLVHLFHFHVGLLQLELLLAQPVRHRGRFFEQLFRFCALPARHGARWRSCRKSGEAM